MKLNLFVNHKEIEIYVSKLLLENKSFTRLSNSINSVTQFSLLPLRFSPYAVPVSEHILLYKIRRLIIFSDALLFLAWKVDSRPFVKYLYQRTCDVFNYKKFSCSVTSLMIPIVNHIFKKRLR